jgi:hypothetical protein
MTEETLVRQTLELARIVRSAILYLRYFVHIEEKKKKAKSKRTMTPIFAQEIRDDLKSRR